MHRKAVGLTLLAPFACALLAGPTAAQDWTKSKWGPDDEIGSANYMTPELVVKAAQLIKTGKTYALGIETNSKTPAFPPRTFKITILQPGQAGTSGLGPSKTTYNDDIIDGWVGIGSQIDGLGHIGVDHVYYNGIKASDFADANGLKKLGVEKVPPMVARGVLLDMAAHFGTDVVKEGTAFNTHGDRGGRQEAGRRDPPGRRGAVPHRLGQPDRQGRQALQLRRAGPRRRRRQVPGEQGRGGGRAPTPGGSRCCPSRARTSSRCTRSCCR